jgi:hypothetical protein
VLVTGRSADRSSARSARRWRRATHAERLFGAPPFDRLARSHGLITAADAFFGVSLAGSLFFNVSVDAARPRILLYLVVTMAPFAVIAPLLGPFVDRLPGGQRLAITVTCAGRGVVCLILADELRTLLLYPLAFSVLVLGKTYSIAKNTLVPRLIGDPNAFVEANSRLSRLATYAGTVAAVSGAAILGVVGAAWTLRVGGAVYLAAAVFALRLPRPAHAPLVPRLAERRGLQARGLRAAASAMGALRAAVGFVVFLLAIGLKRSGEPTWFFGAVFAAHAAGGFAGTFVAPRMRRVVGEERLLALALALAGGLGVLASLGPGRLAIVAVAGVVGTCANAGRQAFDSLVQRDAQDVERGWLFARFETRFQLSWVLGAFVAVAIQPPLWAGFLIVGSASSLAALRYFEAGRPSVREPAAERSVPTVPEEPAASPAERLLAAAEDLAHRGELDVAVVVAAASLDAARAAALDDDAVIAGDQISLSDALVRLRRMVMDGTPVSAEETAQVLELARSAIPPTSERRSRE